jgi:hypothetical protein
MIQPLGHDEPETEDGTMNGYATHELAKIRQHEFMAEAAQSRLAKEARLASRRTAVSARPLAWLRGAAHGFAIRLVTLRSAHVGGH